MQPEALALVRKMLRWESVGDRLGDRVEEEEPGCGSAAGAAFQTIQSHRSPLWAVFVIQFLFLDAVVS